CEELHERGSVSQIRRSTQTRRILLPGSNVVPVRPSRHRGDPMRIAIRIAAVAIAVAAYPTLALAKPPALMDREQEIALALSAAPPSVASKAGVYVLDKTGYVKARDSQNGFVCIVDHRIPAAVEPQCPDEEGAKTFLPRAFLIAKLRAEGKAEPE